MRNKYPAGVALAAGGGLLIAVSSTARLLGGDFPIELKVTGASAVVAIVLILLAWFNWYGRFTRWQAMIPKEIRRKIYGASVLKFGEYMDLLDEAEVQFPISRKVALIWSEDGLAVYDLESHNSRKIPQKRIDIVGFSSSGTPGKLGHLHFQVGRFPFKTLIYSLGENSSLELLDDGMEDLVIQAFD